MLIFFQVTHKKTERKYAMKIVKKELVNDDEVRDLELFPFLFYQACCSL